MDYGSDQGSELCHRLHAIHTNTPHAHDRTHDTLIHVYTHHSHIRTNTQTRPAMHAKADYAARVFDAAHTHTHTHTHTQTHTHTHTHTHGTHGRGCSDIDTHISRPSAVKRRAAAHPS